MDRPFQEELKQGATEAGAEFAQGNYLTGAAKLAKNVVSAGVTYSQIKDVEQRRAAIQDAANKAEWQRSPTLGLDGPLTGQLVRRR